MPQFKPNKPSKDVITIRINTDTLNKIDAQAAAIGISRNELINQMINFAMNSMADSGEKP